MGKFCPITGGKVVYLTCQECEDRVCEKQPKISILPKREQKPVETKKQPDKVPGAVGFTNPTQTGQRGPHEACETCCHKTGEAVDNVFGITHITYCEIYRNYLINSEEISWEGCLYHNKDMSNERICMNCKSYLGGSDWGLSCGENYHTLTTPLNQACKHFKPKQ